HLFGMAPTQRTGAAERACINDGDRPPRGMTPEGRGGSGGARPNDNQVILSLLFCHALPTSLYTPVTTTSRWWPVRKRFVNQTCPGTCVQHVSCTPGSHAMHGLTGGNARTRGNDARTERQPALHRRSAVRCHPEIWYHLSGIPSWRCKA